MSSRSSRPAEPRIDRLTSPQPSSSMASRGRTSLCTRATQGQAVSLGSRSMFGWGEKVPDVQHGPGGRAASGRAQALPGAQRT